MTDKGKHYKQNLKSGFIELCCCDFMEESHRMTWFNAGLTVLITAVLLLS